jgi:hypothetical protein
MMDCTEWQPYFAWKPVYVDAYDVSEIKNHKMRFLKWGWVERRFCKWTDVDDEDRVEHRAWRFRLSRTPQESASD